MKTLCLAQNDLLALLPQEDCRFGISAHDLADANWVEREGPGEYATTVPVRIFIVLCQSPMVHCFSGSAVARESGKGMVCYVSGPMIEPDLSDDTFEMLFRAASRVLDEKLGIHPNQTPSLSPIAVVRDRNLDTDEHCFGVVFVGESAANELPDTATRLVVEAQFAPPDIASDPRFDNVSRRIAALISSLIDGSYFRGSSSTSASPEP